jgi:SAM-dependent methyltransferase
MTEIESSNQSAHNRRPSLPIEVLERGRREREFFDRYTDPDKISDKLLRVTPRLEQMDLPTEVLALAPHLSGKRTCEFGCGYGLYSAYFALKGAAAFGFDISESNIRVARRTACVNGVESRIRLEVMQGECTSYPNDYFDLVFGCGVLHHLDLRLAAEEIHRILRPGGVGIFLDPLGESKLLEWARNCPLRSSNHQHTADERSLRYEDLEALRSVFPDMSYREMALLTVVRAVFRKVEAGMIAIPRAERALKLLSNLDDWLLKRVPAVRPFASYLVISLLKPSNADSGSSSDLGRILQRHCDRVRRWKSND